MSTPATDSGKRPIGLWALPGLGTILVGGLLLIAALPSPRRRGPSRFI